ncbi:MAG: hypothetical protein ACKVX9_06075, partial [Blastocatellia bacterium]
RAPAGAPDRATLYRPCRGSMAFPVNSGGYASLHRRLPSGVPSEHNNAPIVHQYSEIVSHF